MKITEVRLVKVEGVYDDSGVRSVERQVGALDLYPEYRAQGHRTAAEPGHPVQSAISDVYVEIATDEGLTGIFGPIFEEQAYLIDTRLRRYLIGQDPLATERIWDVLSRHDRHARKGNQMMAISAVDLALWDIRGKAAGLPVYRLLGGPTREAVQAYASCLGYSLEPGDVTRQAQALAAEGYAAQKWFFRYGPGEGRAALERNMMLVRTVREAVGQDSDLMFDAWLGWDVPFAVEMGRRMAPYDPRWLEEPVPPDRISAYAEIRRQTGIPIAGGEHEYTRWGFKVLLDAQAIDVIQADPDWTGGITEMVKICALASAYGVQVIPHGHSVLPALHVIAAQSPEVCPLLEYLILHNARKQWFHTVQYAPAHGMVALPTMPGLGIALDPERVHRRTELHWA